MQTENVNIKNWKSLIKPTKLDVKISDDLTHAKIIAEPLEKGYGLTLGNSLRRILLYLLLILMVMLFLGPQQDKKVLKVQENLPLMLLK